MSTIDSDRYTIHHADALAVLRGLPNDSVDAIITDPPYSSGGFTRGDRNQTPSLKYQQSDTIDLKQDFNGDNRDGRSWRYWCQLWMSECLRIVKPSGYLLSFTDWRQLPLASDAIQSAGFVWRGVIVWDKGLSARAPHKGYFRHQAEYITWGTKGVSVAATHDGPFPGVISIGSPRIRDHMTEKPVALMRELCRVVPPGGVILDPFGGAHSTGVAAILTGRRYIGVEQSRHYHDIGLRRVRQAVTDVEGECFMQDLREPRAKESA
jgi:site-specific DNA-methyltransferase (adenine-specific)